jgi:hypothetical protein
MTPLNNRQLCPQSRRERKPMARAMKAQYGSFIEKAAVSIQKAPVRKI